MSTKKYVSLDKLGLYDEKIKKFMADADAVALDSAKKYADGLGVNYDAAGSAATVQGKLDEEVIRAKAREDEVEGKVTALGNLVGQLPEGTTAATVVEYVNKKTEGIATDAALGELNSQVSGLQTAVQGITSDYLKAADKTELNDAIVAEKNRAEGIEGGLRTDINTVMGDYLKAADKTELQGNIDDVAEDVAAIAEDYLKAADKTELNNAIALKADKTYVDEKVETLQGVDESLQNQINTIMNNPDTEGVINSINEFTQYIADHGEIADGFRADIDQNKADIAAEVKRAGEAEVALSGRLDVLEAIDHDAYVDADTALKNELNGEIAKKADATALSSAVEALEGADTALSGRIATLEGKFGEGDGNVAGMIATAKQEAIDAAAGDATSKANAAETAAKGHADSLNTAMNSRVEALEAIDHTHSNKAELDLIVSGDKAKWDAAAAKAHEHSNLTVLEGVTAAKITAWDAAEGNAKTYADGLNTAMNTRVATLEGWHENFVECSQEDIQGLFA